MHHTRWLFMLTFATLVMPLPSAHGESGVQVTRDGSKHLVSKDVGNERWAITYDTSDHTATGNVFRNDGGEPAFVSCDTLSTTNGEVTLRCFGADRCQSSPCPLGDWKFIADATLPLQFFYPPGALATPAPVETPRPTTTPAPPSDPLAALIGTWNFTFTIISTFTDTYRLQSIDTSTGTRILRGLDQFGDLVIAARFQDLVSGSAPYDFALLDPGVTLCEFHVFDRTGSTTLSGETFIVFTDSQGRCDSSSLGQPYALQGTRLSTAAAIPSAAALAGDLTSAREARADSVAAELLTAGPSRVDQDTPRLDQVRRMLDSLQP